MDNVPSLGEGEEEKEMNYKITVFFKGRACKVYNFSTKPILTTGIGGFAVIKHRTDELEIYINKDDIASVRLERLAQPGEKLDRLFKEVVKAAREEEVSASDEEVEIEDL